VRKKKKRFPYPAIGNLFPHCLDSFISQVGQGFAGEWAVGTPRVVPENFLYRQP
jgi:hypothetical protein